MGHHVSIKSVVIHAIVSVLVSSCMWVWLSYEPTDTTASGPVTRYVLNSLIPGIVMAAAEQRSANSLIVAAPDGSQAPSAITFNSAGSINVQTSSSGVGNGADATDDTLFSYTLPANTLQSNGQMLLSIGAFKGANNSHTKVVKYFFDGNALSNAGTFTTAASSGVIGILITRLSSTSVMAVAVSMSGDSPNSGLHVLVTATQTVADLSSNAVIFKMTGASPGSSAASDVLGYAMGTWLMN